MIESSPDAESPNTGADFERQKWQEDLALRKEQLALRKLELHARINEHRRSHWTRLLLIALAAAALAVFGVASIALINSQHAREARSLASLVSRDIAQCPPGEARRDLGLQWLDVSCRYRFPPNNGFKGLPVDKTLSPGTAVDRYGQPAGRFLAPAASPYGGRALPYDQAKMDYYRYEVVKEFTVKAGDAVPWFDQPGGDIQYMTDKPVRQLIIDGYLKEVERLERDRQ
jgi:hypothetical protein